MRNRNPYVGVTSIWHERYLECSRTCMTSMFYDSVMRFYKSLLDLDNNDKAIWTKVNKYYEEEWSPMVKKIIIDNTRNIVDESAKDGEYRIEAPKHIDKLYRKIIQTIQDSGVGFQTFSDIDADSSDYDDAFKN